ncbi:MAG: aldose epimerase family protein [Christensenellaceae bacterium]|jgi:aldose 1-epimerase
MVFAERCLEKNGKALFCYTIQTKSGASVRLTNFGATVMSIKMPDKSGQLDELVMGFDDVGEYFENPLYFGSTIGRVANRIAGSAFEIGGKRYCIPPNENGINLLHSGSEGLHKQIFDAAYVPDGNSVEFSYFSPDGEAGFPGNVKIYVAMTLEENNVFRIEYGAQADEDTPLNLTNHSYFNLAGSGRIDSHILQVYAEGYTPVNSSLIPTGEVAPVSGTPFDFRQTRPIGQHICDDDEQIKLAGGYDHNYAIGGEGFRIAAHVEDAASGRAMDVYTDMPGMQLYTANFVAPAEGRGAFAYGPQKAYCFETQFFPDSVNQPNFLSCVQKAGKPYKSKTEYRFTVK